MNSGSSSYVGSGLWGMLSSRPLAIFGMACLVAIWTIMDPIVEISCGRASCGVGSFDGGSQVLILCLLTPGFCFSRRRMKNLKIFSSYSRMNNLRAFNLVFTSFLTLATHLWRSSNFVSSGSDCHKRLKSSTLCIVLRSPYASSH